VEPNPFYEPEFLLASARDLRHGDIRCIAVYADGERGSDLIGLFPLQTARLMRAAPLPSLEFYRNDFVCLTAPLIDSRDPAGIWGSFFDAFSRDRPMPGTVLSHFMPANRILKEALEETLAARGLVKATVAQFERAAVGPTDLDFDTYQSRFSGRRNKDLRRRARRLSEQGEVTIRTVSGADTDGRAALEDFLRIEASGWKGREGTAMASDPTTDAFAKAVFAGPDVEFDVLALDGKAIAVTVNLIRNGAVFTIKTAYDEDHRPASPGAMLDLHLIRNITEGRYSRADSCAIADHPVESYWLEKQPIECVALATRPGVSQMRIDALAATLNSFSRLKNWMKEQVGRD
jgi:CelD/BcsL family acetyltransferase involved in cellulose biosynthesis